MPSFTVGPYEARSNDYFGTRIEMPHDVWKFQDDYAPEMDDLRLLAGSWEMYAALQAVVAALDVPIYAESERERCRTRVDLMFEAIEAARPVLAKIGAESA
jgi:hypothetical protein